MYHILSLDGGVVVKNPAMCALAQAIDRATGGQALADVALLSAGTGRNALDGIAELRRLMEVARTEDLSATTAWLQRHF